MVVPVCVAPSGPVVGLVGMVFCRPLPGLVCDLAVSLLLVGAWCRSVYVAHSFVALGRGLVVGPRGRSVTVSLRGLSPLLVVGAGRRMAVFLLALGCQWLYG